MNHGRAIYAATNDNAPAPFQISYIIRTHLRFRARSRARRFARIVFAYRFAFIDVTSYPGLSVLYCIKYIVIYIYIYIYIYIFARSGNSRVQQVPAGQRVGGAT